MSFLQGLGFKGVADRQVIGLLKALGFLTSAGEPTQRYYAFLDQTQGARVLAEAVQEAYADLFQVNTKAYDLSNAEIKNKLKTLTQGQFSDSVLGKMAGTFKALGALADFSAKAPSADQPGGDCAEQAEQAREAFATYLAGLEGPSRVPLLKVAKPSSGSCEKRVSSIRGAIRFDS